MIQMTAGRNSLSSTGTGKWLFAFAITALGIETPERAFSARGGGGTLIALAPIATLIPSWIPWHVFWIGFFGVGFVASGLSIGRDRLHPYGAYGLGLMFCIWVFTLHLPRVLGLYRIPGAPHNPNEWESLFIAIALWGGPWALGQTAF